MSEYSEKVCDLKHELNDKEHAAMRELLKVIHEGDEKFICREVAIISRSLEEIPQLVDRISKLERWRYYILGAWATSLVAIPLIIKLVLHLMGF